MKRLALVLLASAACSSLELGTSIESSTVSQYAYDATGLPTGLAVHPRDALGRATSVNGAALTYGPDGVLAHAQRGTTSIDYITDEAGHRLAKRVNGQFVEAYVDEGLVTTELVTPLRVANVTVGVVHDGAFESVAADPRGTLLADAAGVTRADAFGARARPSKLERAIDFAQSGRDPDLAIIRMGVRDYDPATHTFLTPDPLFLAEPDKCVESPVECNLYSYVGNRPADFVDTAGTKRNFVLGASGGPAGFEFIKAGGWRDWRDWSLKFELGMAGKDFNVGLTDRSVAQSDLGAKFTFDAKLKAGSMTLFNAKIDAKASVMSKPSIELSERVLWQQSGVKIDEDGIKSQHDATQKGKPGTDLTPTKAELKAVVSITINSKDVLSLPDQAMELLGRWTDALNPIHFVDCCH